MIYPYLSYLFHSIPRYLDCALHTSTLSDALLRPLGAAEARQEVSAALAVCPMESHWARELQQWIDEWLAR